MAPVLAALGRAGYAFGISLWVSSNVYMPLIYLLGEAPPSWMVRMADAFAFLNAAWILSFASLSVAAGAMLARALLPNVASAVSAALLFSLLVPAAGTIHVVVREISAFFAVDPVLRSVFYFLSALLYMSMVYYVLVRTGFASEVP